MWFYGPRCEKLPEAAFAFRTPSRGRLRFAWSAEPPKTSEAQMESESTVPSTQESDNEERTPIETLSETPELYSGVVSRDLFSEPSETSRKRPPPSPEKSGNPEPKKAAASNGKPETAAKP